MKWAGRFPGKPRADAAHEPIAAEKEGGWEYVEIDGLRHLRVQEPQVPGKKDGILDTVSLDTPAVRWVTPVTANREELIGRHRTLPSRSTLRRDQRAGGRNGR
jgi:hypothetical protein